MEELTNGKPRKKPTPEAPFWETQKEELWQLWENLVETRPRIEKGQTHKLTTAQITEIIDQFNFNPIFQRQLEWDLTHAKYKLWDELAMLVYPPSPRTTRYDIPEELEKQTLAKAKELGTLYLKCKQTVLEKQVPEKQQVPELYACFIDDLEELHKSKKKK